KLPPRRCCCARRARGDTSAFTQRPFHRRTDAGRVMNSQGTLLGILAVLGAAALWGTTGTAATFAPNAGPLAMGAAALGIGGILQALIAIPALHVSRPQLRTNVPVVALGALAMAIYPLAFYSSMHLAGVALGSVVSLASAPLASGVLERLVQRTVLSRWWMLAAGLGITGSALLCFSTMFYKPADAAMTMLGIVLGLVAGATYATYSWCAQRLMSQGISRAASMGAIFGTGGTLLMPVLFLTGEPLLASPQPLFVATYMQLIHMFLGYFLVADSISTLNASTSTTSSLSEPAFAAGLSVVVVSERLCRTGWTELGIIAMALCILAIAPTNTASGGSKIPVGASTPRAR